METIDYLENANICRRLIRAEINLREKECATTLKQDIKRIRKGNVYKREGEPFKLSFFYDMFEYTEIKDRDECDSTRTKLSPRSARRYLNGKDNVDKNFNLFLDLSLEILEIDKWAFFEM